MPQYGETADESLSFEENDELRMEDGQRDFGHSAGLQGLVDRLQKFPSGPSLSCSSQSKKSGNGKLSRTRSGIQNPKSDVNNSAQIVNSTGNFGLEIISFMKEIYNKLDSMEKKLDQSMAKVGVLENIVKIQDARITELCKDVTGIGLLIDKLANQLDRIDQQTRLKNLIIFGPAVQEFLVSKKDFGAADVVTLMNDVLSADLPSDDLDEAVLLKRKNDEHSIVVTVNSLKSKYKIFSKIKASNGTVRGLFVNEFLSATKSEIHYKLRLLKKASQNRITNIFIRKGNLFVKLIDQEKWIPITSDSDVEALRSRLNCA